MAQTPDVVFVLFNVHGSAFHKLLQLHERVQAAGLSSRVLISDSAPRGLQRDIDYTEATASKLAQTNVFIMSRPEIIEAVTQTPARLYLFDIIADKDTAGLIETVRSLHGARTAQIGMLIADMAYYGADFLFIQHPLTLWFDLDFCRTRESKRLHEVKKVFFCGNIYYEPVVNRWTTDVDGRDAFFTKYGLDPNKPLVLWLPDRMDGFSKDYGKIIDAVRGADMNLAVKMHPWEYKLAGHGFDPENKQTTSAEMWNVRAIEEKDGTWAYRFCDLVICRGSSTGLEMALWKKPAVSIPADAKYSKIYSIQSDLTRGSVVNLESVEQLPAFLAQRGYQAITDSDYQATVGRIFSRTTPDSFDQHLAAIREALTMKLPEKGLGKKGIRHLFMHLIPLSYLKKARHVPQYVLSRVRHRLKGSKS